MKTVALIAQKGGSGKTTLALHLAVASSLERRTAVIDLDPQASAARWHDRREADAPVVISAHASRLPQELERVREAGGELVVLDTAPHSNSTALAAAKASDLVLVPCRPAILDIEAVSSTLDLIRTTRTPAVVVLNGRPPRGRETGQAIEAVEALGVEVAPASLGQRVMFHRSLTTGQSALERSRGKAAREAATLAAFVFRRLQDA